MTAWPLCPYFLPRSKSSFKPCICRDMPRFAIPSFGHAPCEQETSNEAPDDKRRSVDRSREMEGVTLWIIKFDVSTLHGIDISHLGKRKIIFKMPFWGDILVPWRVPCGGFLVPVGDWHSFVGAVWWSFVHGFKTNRSILHTQSYYLNSSSFWTASPPRNQLLESLCREIESPT